MSLRTTVSTLAVMVLLGTGLLALLQRQLSGAWFTFGVHPQVLDLLERSLDDQKTLARDRPERAAEYRQRFDTIRTTVNNLRILQHSREAIVTRYELLLLAILGGTLLLSGGVWVVSTRRNEVRLQRLQHSLTKLSLGHTGISTGERRRDTIGRIAAMIERTSRRMARDRHRLASLRHLDAWQQAARRQAHEMRTPLTAARLELSRLQSLLAGERNDGGGPPAGDCAHLGGWCQTPRLPSPALRPAGCVAPPRSRAKLRLRRRALPAIRIPRRMEGVEYDTSHLVRGVGEELTRLERFARQFSSFARLASPQLVATDLTALLAELCDLYGTAWENLSLHCEPVAATVTAMVDPGMLRQVLVNLCENSSLALGGATGSVTIGLSSRSDGIVIEVQDDGPGIDPSIRDRVLEPYTTTRDIGQGSGLGLAISRKIMLDHGGDLELAETSSRGTVFRLLLPLPAAEDTP